MTSLSEDVLGSTFDPIALCFRISRMHATMDGIIITEAERKVKGIPEYARIRAPIAGPTMSPTATYAV